MRQFVPVALLGAIGPVGLVTLPVSASQPPEPPITITLKGVMGSQARFFDDERVRELLLRHHIQVHVTRMGSINAVTGDLKPFDFVLTSGQPAAEFLVDRGRATGENYSVHRVFVSPIVLATYRDHAETLRAAGIARPQATPGFDRPYYYDLDMARFLALIKEKKSWNDLNGRVVSSTQILAQTPSVCGSNSGASYVGLVSYVEHRRVPSLDEAAGFAATVKDLISPQGLPPPAPEIYFLPEGKELAPIMVLYEHQYLAHQLDYRTQTGQLDDDRVLLYPSAASPAQAIFVALNQRADPLGKLLLTDENLRKRAVELGMQVIKPDGGHLPEQLPRYLAEQGVPMPRRYQAEGDQPPLDSGTALLPDVRQLKKMIEIVGEC